MHVQNVCSAVLASRDWPSEGSLTCSMLPQCWVPRTASVKSHWAENSAMELPHLLQKQSEPEHETVPRLMHWSCSFKFLFVRCGLNRSGGVWSKHFGDNTNSWIEPLPLRSRVNSTSRSNIRRGCKPKVFTEVAWNSLAPAPWTLFDNVTFGQDLVLV